MEPEPALDDAHAQLDRLERKLDTIQQTVQQLKLYFTIMVWVSVGMVLLPLLGIVVLLPMLLSTLTSVAGL